ncbi:hypothetical protein B0H34DRAFT_250448 [Crassisporium funariophilum]|nr:hypothetical protein B0H34DRAFT_250448 [Crassisporium funariophilum]
MLKAHQACIDLEKGVLRIQGREVRFLSEHELPDKARDPQEPPEDFASGPSALAGQRTQSTPAAGGAASSSFPGGGRSIGAPPTAAPISQAQRPSQPAAAAASHHPENSVRILMDLGVSREVALQTLDAAGGNIDVAASLLF